MYMNVTARWQVLGTSNTVELVALKTLKPVQALVVGIEQTNEFACLSVTQRDLSRPVIDELFSLRGRFHTAGEVVRTEKSSRSNVVCPFCFHVGKLFHT